MRTSVDHGTAFDIAGKGLVDEANMITAMTMASEMALGRIKDQQKRYDCVMCSYLYACMFVFYNPQRRSADCLCLILMCVINIFI